MMGSTRDIEDYEKISFEEESAYLDSVESRIDAMIGRIDSKIVPLESDLSDWCTVDYEDVDRKRYVLRRLERLKEEKSKIEEYKPEPYFCHFEVVVDGELSREFCIGNRQDALRDDNGIVVLGRWSPLRVIYINNGQTHFDIEIEGKNRSYELRLRRMVQIKDGTLVGMSTEYDSADTSLEGQVVDPFLIAVLRDKRRDYKLSDIVKTIQQNQNEILERPIGESFVVQGCAGSGKTMILLHRLSYLAFTYPETDFSKYVILTPNESFNRHIDELCEELDIESITRLTVESYYVRLARRLARNDTKAQTGKTSKEKQLPKIRVYSENVIPEYDLPEEYLSEVYSEAFAARISELFNEEKRRVINEIEAGPVGEMFFRKGLEIPGGDAVPYKVYLAITRSCAKIRRDSSAAFEKVEAARKERDEIAERLEEASTAYNSAIELLEPARAAVIEKALPLFKSKERELDGLRREASNARARERRAEAAIERASARITEIYEALDEAKAESESSRELASLEVSAADMKSDSEVIEVARLECMEEQADVARIQAELDEIGIFGFGRRRAVREELELAKSRLQIRFEKALEDASEERAALIRRDRVKAAEDSEARLISVAESGTEAKNNFAAATERLNKAKGKREAIAPAVEEVRAETEVLRQPIKAFEEERYPNLSSIEDMRSLESSSPELAEYARICKGLTATQTRYLHLGKNKVQSLTKQLATAQTAVEEAEKDLITDVDVAVLAEAERFGSMLDATAFEVLLEQELSAVRSSHCVSVIGGENYRYELYLKALECTLYYGSVQDDGVSICIDEAQDLSLAELRLIRLAVGPGAALNLYGDTNQLIYAYKGVRSWSDLPEGIVTNRYDLNENYRNTLQITKYCNERLGMDVTAVGLKGPEVSRLSLQSGIDELFALRGTESGVRCAVIYKRGLSGVKKRLDELLGADASYGLVDASRISVIPVDVAKGLEFDAVVVIDNGMSENERYLSFSRALDNLIVTHVKGAAVEGVEEISPEGGRAVGVSKLKETVVKTAEPQVKTELNDERPIADPFFDLDFS